MFITRRLVDRIDGWGLRVTRNDLPFQICVAVGGTQTGTGHVVIRQSRVAWIGTCKKGVLISHRMAFKNVKGPFPTKTYRFYTMRLAWIRNTWPHYTRLIPAIDWGPETTLVPPEDWRGLFCLAKAGRKDKDGSVIFDWLLENAPYEAQPLLHGECLPSQFLMPKETE